MARIFLFLGAIKASLIVMPSFVLIGIFCKFGSEEDNLPVEVTAWWYDVWTLEFWSQISEILSVYVLFSLAKDRYSKMSFTISFSSDNFCKTDSEVEK